MLVLWGRMLMGGGAPRPAAAMPAAGAKTATLVSIGGTRTSGGGTALGAWLADR